MLFFLWNTFLKVRKWLYRLTQSSCEPLHLPWHLYWFCAYTSVNCLNLKASVKWFTGVTVLLGCCKPVQHEISNQFYYPRALPSPKFLPCRRGLRKLWVPLNQPSLARKRQELRLESGFVWDRSSVREPHAPDQASSLRFSCSLCCFQPQETWWPQVSKHTRDRLSVPLQCCLCILVIYVLVYILCMQHISI